MTATAGGPQGFGGASGAWNEAGVGVWRWRLYRQPSRQAAEARRLLGPWRRSEIPDDSARPRPTISSSAICATCSSASDAVDRRFDEVYQLAADMGGAGYIFTGENDADVMHNSAQINLNMLEACRRRNSKRIFYSSSACIYPEHNQKRTGPPGTAPRTGAYPAAPDSEYGWEKLFSERLYLAYRRNHGFNVRIARYHNIFGPEGAWNDGTREGAGRALPQGRRGKRGRRGGDLGRRRADAIVPLYRRVPRGHAATDALGLQRTCSMSAPTRWSPSMPSWR